MARFQMTTLVLLRTWNILMKENSDLDIELPDHTNDSFYHSILCESLPKAIERFSPDFIFYQAGVDVLETDKLGKLSLSN